MRRLNRKRALSLVKELDAFPKVPESYVETSAFGGAASLIVFASMALLTILEFFVYQDTWMKYEYEVDKDFFSKLRINIDITVAMECQNASEEIRHKLIHWHKERESQKKRHQLLRLNVGVVGADVLDRANTMVSLTGLKYEPVNFELNPRQRLWQKALLQSQSKLREEQSLQHVLFRDAVKEFLFPPILRSDSLSGPLNACRILGHFYVNKVEGNLHFTLGKAVHYSGGHAHFGSLLTNNVQNFSHRIDRLSFGEVVPGRVNPLDATEKITLEREQQFQYFVTIVPTKLRTSELSIDTHQYSVTEQERVINHTSGSHGASGIFVKYKLNPLMVRVTEEHMPIGKFLVRLSGIIGGIFSTSDLLHRLVGLFVDIVCCRCNLGALRPRQVLS